MYSYKLMTEAIYKNNEHIYFDIFFLDDSNFE